MPNSAGDNITVDVKITQQGNSSGYIDKVLLSLRTCKIDTWARSFAETENQKRETDGCFTIPTTQHPDFSAGAGEDVALRKAGDLLRQTRSMEELCKADTFGLYHQREKDDLRERKRKVSVLRHNATYTEYEPMRFTLYL